MAEKSDMAIPEKSDRPRCERSPLRRAVRLRWVGVLNATWLAVAWLTAVGAIAEEPTSVEELPPLLVSHVGADAVYLNGGRSHGLEVGQHIAITRQGEPIAELQVAFVSKRSASCRVVDSRLEIVLGDQASPLLGMAAETATPGQGATAGGGSGGRPPTVGTSPEGERSETPPRSGWRGSGLRGSDLSGTISLRWHQFDDGNEFPRSFDQTTARLNLRSRSPDGTYQARVRVRGREDRRTRDSEPTETSRRDRLYELSFAYAPPEGRIAVEVGRMTSSPRLGFDYLDGVLAEVAIRPGIGVGAFYGQRSEIDELSLGGAGQAYGAFFHYHRKRSRESPFYADVVVGGIRETFEGEVSRDYVSLYGRLGKGNRWSIYQRADVDVNTDWRRDVAGDDYQVSNIVTSANYRFSDSLRMGISYDHRRRFRDFENRDTPEEIFDDRLREGFRVSAQIGDSRGWRLSSSVGIRREEDRAEDAYTASGSLFHTNLGGLGLLVGLDFSGFQGDTADGYRVSLRSRKYFDGGHDVGLTLGFSTTTNAFTGDPIESEHHWVRLSGSVRLPKRFFLLGEIEVTEGDDLAGQRYILQLGYRL